MNASSTLILAFALVSRNGISCSLAIWKKNISCYLNFREGITGLFSCCHDIMYIKYKQKIIKLSVKK
mgnify:CR=1 FL=1